MTLLPLEATRRSRASNQVWQLSKAKRTTHFAAAVNKCSERCKPEKPLVFLSLWDSIEAKCEKSKLAMGQQPASCTMASLSASRALVASSKTRILQQAAFKVVLFCMEAITYIALSIL